MTIPAKRSLFYLPYNLLLLTAFLLAVTPLFYEGQSDLFLLFNHTVFITSEALLWLFAFIFLIWWIIYWRTDKFLLKHSLTWIHILATLLIVAFWITARKWGFKYPSDKPEVVIYTNILRDTPRQLKISLFWKSIFIAGQLVYALNLVGGIIKKSVASKAGNSNLQ